MARYTYDAALVSQAIDKLYSAGNALNNTTADIQKGINTITRAKGAGYIDANFGVITGYQSQVVEFIDTMSEELKSKAQEIEEFENAPWYLKLWNTIAMGGMKILEGIATFAENLGDGVVSIVGFGSGLFGNTEFQNSCAEYVKQDQAGDSFAKAYEEGWLKDVNKYSYMSHESTAANVLKGIGVAAGHVIVSAIPGIGLGATAGVAGLAGIGSGTQAGLQSGKTFNAAFVDGLKQGAVAAGTTLIAGGIANKIKAAKTTALSTATTSAASSSTNLGTKIMTAAGTFVTNHPVISSGIAIAATGVGVNQKIENAVASTQFRIEKNEEENVTPGEGLEQHLNESKDDFDIVISEDVTSETDEHPVVNEEPAGDAESGEGVEIKPPVEGLVIGGAIGGIQALYGPPVNEVIAKPIVGTVIGGGAGGGEGDQVLYGPPPVNEVITKPIVGTVIGGGEGDQVLYGPPPVNEVITKPIIDTAVGGGAGGGEGDQVLYGPPIVSTITQEQSTQVPSTESIITSHTSSNTETPITKISKVDTLRKNTIANSGSLDNIISGSSTNIPKSSTPLKANDSTNSISSKAVPITAGIGAAGIVGLGTKTYLDKHNSDEETDDKINAEEWDEDVDLMNIDYATASQNEEEADYLSPTDEYAFQE